MEYSLTLEIPLSKSVTFSLNPYSNGILSDYALAGWNIRKDLCLNPYSNGILSDIIDLDRHDEEAGLNPYSNGILSDWFY